MKSIDEKLKMIWYHMMDRCYNQHSSSYGSYGARGIVVHESWHDREVFLSWAISRYRKGLELDKDLLGGMEYGPDTCKFIPKALNMFITKGNLKKDFPIPSIFIRRRYEVSFTFKGKLFSKRFETIQEAINYYIDSKIEKGTDSFKEFSKEILELFESRRIEYLLYIKNNAEKFPPLRGTIRSYNLPSVGQKFKSVRGDWYQVVDVVNADNILIQFDTGETKIVSNERIKQGFIPRQGRILERDWKIISEKIDSYFFTKESGMLKGVNIGKTSITAFYNGKRVCVKTYKEALNIRLEDLRRKTSKLCEKYPKHRDSIWCYFNTNIAKVISNTDFMNT